MPTIRGRYAKSVVLLFLCGTYLFCLLGCASSSSSSIEYTSQSKLGPDEGLVCGRVTTLRGDKPVDWNHGTFTLVTMQVYVMPESGGANARYVLRGDGRFCWHLQQGRYVISSFEWQAGLSTFSGRIWAEFTVPAAGSRTCLGTLVLRFTGDRYGYHVLDECNAILADWGATTSQWPNEWQKQLMVLEPSK
jgi:hypothetical protein